MKPWAAFFPDLLPRLLGIPDPLLEQELRRVATQYFSRTRAWVEWTPAITTQPDVRTYPLDIPPHATVVSVDKATIGKKPIEMVAWRFIESDPDVNFRGHPSASSASRLDLTLDVANSDGETLQAQVSLKPSRNAPGLPDALFEHHADAIIEGTLARCMLIQGQTFSNPQMASIHEANYQAALGAAGARAFRSESVATPRRRVQWH